METSEKNQGTHGTDGAEPIEETQGASQGDMGGKGCEPTSVQEDPGATIQQTEGKTTAEIQKELDKIANESRMTISVAPTVQLKDGRARVNVINVEDNKFDQTFTLSQDGKDIYTSGIVKCGQKVEWCEADGLSEGTATITVQAVNKKTGKAYGNPQSVEVEVTKGAVD